MKKLMTIWLLCLPLMAVAQNTTTNDDKVATLQAEAAAKAKAAQEAAQEAVRLAQEAAAAAEAARVAQEESVSAPDTQGTWTTAPTEEQQPPMTITEQKRAEREEALSSMTPYVAEGAVPIVDGKVKWSKDITVPGQTAQQLYTKILTLLTAMTKEGNQLERSKVALLNEKEHKVVATFQEWLVFTSTALSLDRTQFNYIILAECSDGHLTLTLDRISYHYPTQKGFENYQAENWITDKYSVNKKHTRLLPINGKFRRKTIDRKNQLFEYIEKNLQ